MVNPAEVGSLLQGAPRSAKEVQPMSPTVPSAEPKALQYSRRVWAALLGFLPMVITLLTQFGVNVPLPTGLVEGLDGVVQSLFGSAVAGLALWSKFKPDPPVA